MDEERLKQVLLELQSQNAHLLDEVHNLHIELIELKQELAKPGSKNTPNSEYLYDFTSLEKRHGDLFEHHHKEEKNFNGRLKQQIENLFS
jgi:hypothetical protein